MLILCDSFMAIGKDSIEAEKPTAGERNKGRRGPRAAPASHHRQSWIARWASRKRKTAVGPPAMPAARSQTALLATSCSLSHKSSIMIHTSRQNSPSPGTPDLEVQVHEDIAQLERYRNHLLMFASRGERVVVAMAASFGDWGVGNGGVREVRLQVVQYGDTGHNLMVDSVSAPLKSSSLWAMPWLDAAVQRVLEGFVGLDFATPSAITKDWPLVRSPTPVVVAIVAYIAVVCGWSSYIKRAELKPRAQDPQWLQALVVVHNSFLCCLSFYMGWGILSEARLNRYSFWGNPGHDNHIKMGYYVYIFYVSKLYEFMDTMIMLLRRNVRQISFLHLYHHASISFVWWTISYLQPTGDAYFSAALNSWIHVAMYLYYLLAATIAKDEKRRCKYLFWGKYLTMFQMLQFVSFIGQAVHGLVHPNNYPKNMPRMLFLYSLSLLLLFGNFFVSKYMRQSPKLQLKSVKNN